MTLLTRVKATHVLTIFLIYFSQLRSLNLTRPNALSNEGFGWLSELRQLVRFSVHTSPAFGARGMAALCTLSKLNTLIILRCPNIPSVSFVSLSNLTRLHHFHAIASRFPGNALEHVCRPALERLQISDSNVSILEPLRTCTALRDLSLLSCAFITDTALRALSGLRRLNRLAVTGCQLSGEGLIGARYAAHLHSLRLAPSEIDRTLPSRLTKDGALAIARCVR